MSADSSISNKERILKSFYFFPFQLILLQLKRNLLLLVFWLVLFGFIFNAIGSKYGVSNLFLFPEYNNVNGPLAFGILGFSIGGFVISYNLYTYIIHGFRFPFIATLNKPFLKFSLNNFILPLAFLVCYLVRSFNYQTSQELVTNGDAALNLFSFMIGMVFMITFSFFYFHLTNKNVQYFDSNKKKIKGQEDAHDDAFASSALQRKNSWYALEKRTEDWRIDFYLSSFWKIKLARTSSHYHRNVLEKVFSQHHVNATLFELMVILSFITVGLFREVDIFEIPAAASAVLYFTVLIMVMSAVYSWIKGWTFAILVVAFIILNSSSTLNSYLNLETQVYGLDYSVKKDYEEARISSAVSLANYNESKQEGEKILDRWKFNQTEEKPPLVIVCVSGGGLRSALWTMNTIYQIDSVLEENFYPRVQLISGSSGGMIGASYLRELYLREEFLTNPKSSYENISKDLLNPTLLALATHDLAFRWRKKEVQGVSVLMDRAYSFEEKLHENTNGYLNKSLGDYFELENSADVPLMIYSPVLNGDGRRLLISSQDISYLAYSNPETLEENICYQNIFKDNKPLNTRFSSVLRMNATFPYILPASTLPFNSSIKAADAGLRDNFGMRTALDYVSEFQSWIEKNTSGVIFVEIRDTERLKEKPASKKTIVSEFTNPLGGVYSNIIRNQDYVNQQHLEQVSDLLNVPVKRISFELNSSSIKPVALSWHLTNLEKKIILESSNRAQFQKSLERLKKSL